MRASLPLALALLAPAVLACKTLDEVAIGYADAITTSSIPGEGSYTDAAVTFPALTDVDPLDSPALSRYEVGPEEVESVRVTDVELEGPSGGCGLPFTQLELELVAEALGPVTLATASGGECLEWKLASEAELGPWFRQPSVTIRAVVDGEPWEGAAGSLSLRVGFLIDVKDKQIE